MKKELKIGIIMVLALGFLIWGANFLKGRNFFSSTKNYIVFYSDVSGLLESNGVFIKGYKVGHVGDIDFSDNTLKNLRVVIALEEDVKVPENSVARIFNLDLIGNKGVELIFTDSTKYLHENDTLIGDVEITIAQQLEPYKIQAYNVLKSLDSLSNSVLDAFNPRTVNQLKNTIRNIEYTTEAINASSEYFKSSFGNLEAITRNLRENNKRVTDILKNLKSVTDSISDLQLKQSLTKLNTVLDESENLLLNLKKGKGTLGKLITNDTLYYNLNKASADIDSLIIDLKNNPRRYVNFRVFGKSK